MILRSHDLFKANDVGTEKEPIYTGYLYQYKLKSTDCVRYNVIWNTEDQYLHKAWVLCPSAIEKSNSELVWRMYRFLNNDNK